MCRYGIAVFTKHAGLEVNPNVAFELGVMWEQGKDILILKDARLPQLFTDIVGRIYREFDGAEKYLRLDSNDLYIATVNWLRWNERVVEDSLGVAFVASVVDTVDSDPPMAVRHLETAIQQCIDLIEEMAQIEVDKDLSLRRQVSSLYRNRQLTTFMFRAMNSTLRVCSRFRRFGKLDIKEKQLLLGHARLLRDIFNSWLRNYKDYQSLEEDLRR